MGTDEQSEPATEGLPVQWAEVQIWKTVEALYRWEIRTLQAGDYSTWLRLFTDDLRYWAPVTRVVDNRRDVVAPYGELAYFDETLETMRLRVEKFASKMAWTEYPPSRTRMFLQLLDVAYIEANQWQAASNFMVYQTRQDHREHLFVGERVDRLRHEEDGLRVEQRTIVFDRSRLPSENLSIFF